MQLLDIDDESLLHVTSIATLSLTERYVALQQRQRTTEILTQKVEVSDAVSLLVGEQTRIDFRCFANDCHAKKICFVTMKRI